MSKHLGRMRVSVGRACGVALALGLSSCGASLAPGEARTGEVEVHLLGWSPSPGGAPCGPIEPPLVWAEVGAGAARPGHGLIRFGPCGPQPAASVLPPGSTVVVRNEGAERLELRWTQGAERGQANLAVGGQRRVVLGAQGRLEVEAGGAVALIVAAAVGGRVDAQGRAVLRGLPAGVQRVTVRDPAGEERSATVTVPGGERVTVEVELEARP